MSVSAESPEVEFLEVVNKSSVGSSDLVVVGSVDSVDSSNSPLLPVDVGSPDVVVELVDDQSEVVVVSDVSVSALDVSESLPSSGHGSQEFDVAFPEVGVHADGDELGLSESGADSVEAAGGAGEELGSVALQVGDLLLVPVLPSSDE